MSELEKAIAGYVCMWGNDYVGTNRSQCRDCSQYVCAKCQDIEGILALITQREAAKDESHRKEIARIEQVHEASKFLELAAKDRKHAKSVAAKDEVLREAKIQLSGFHGTEGTIAKIDAALEGK